MSLRIRNGCQRVYLIESMSSPLTVGHCFDVHYLATEANRWLSADTATLYIERPGLPAINPVVYWQRRALVNSKILLSTALFYCAYRDTVRGIASDDHHYYKDRILHLINLALGNPATAVSDDNIAAVISMCMYEVGTLALGIGSEANGFGFRISAAAT